jgi:hypothetical protein
VSSLTHNREPEHEVVVDVQNLRPGDRIPVDTYLGPVTTAEELRIKSVEQAAQGKYAVTFFRIGTLFLHERQQVTIIDTADRVG